MQVLKALFFLLVILVPVGVGGLVLVGGGDGILEDEANIQIRRRSALVYSWCVEPDHRAKWIDGLVKSSHRSVSGMRAGDTFIETHRTDSGTEERRVEITEIVEGRTFAYRTTLAGRPYEVRIEVKAPFQADRTSVNFWYRTKLEGRWAKVAEPLIASKIYGHALEDLERLKRLVEVAAE